MNLHASEEVKKYVENLENQINIAYNALSAIVVKNFHDNEEDVRLITKNIALEAVEKINAIGQTNPRVKGRNS